MFNNTAGYTRLFVRYLKLWNLLPLQKMKRDVTHNNRGNITGENQFILLGEEGEFFLFLSGNAFQQSSGKQVITMAILADRYKFCFHQQFSEEQLLYLFKTKYALGMNSYFLLPLLQYSTSGGLRDCVVFNTQ